MIKGLRIGFCAASGSGKGSTFPAPAGRTNLAQRFRAGKRANNGSSRGGTTRCVDLLVLGALVIVLMAPRVLAQAGNASNVERTYPYSVEVVQQGLQTIGGFGGGKLPVLDGFVTSAVTQVEMYERPYFQYRVHLKSIDAAHTSVSVEALISALYSDPNPARSEYRALPSNGRLETDLLDRLQQALQASAATPAAPLPDSAGSTRAAKAATGKQGIAIKGAPPSQASSPQQQLDAILAERQTVREKTASLQAQLDQLRSGDHKASAGAHWASVKRSGVGVMSRKNFGGPVIFRAQAEDEFEVITLEGGWAQVRIESGTAAYVQADELNLPPGLQDTAAASAVSSGPANSNAGGPDLGFAVSREDVNLFSGDWARLKGKRVLFVYAQPRGLLSDMASEDAKLGYAKRVFQSRLKPLLQSQPDVEGVVVVFLGNRGGVAAAALSDIKQWTEGGLSDEAFVNRCSLDPPAEFRHMRLN